jgi:hypothetical protein
MERYIELWRFYHIVMPQTSSNRADSKALLPPARHIDQRALFQIPCYGPGYNFSQIGFFEY